MKKKICLFEKHFNTIKHSSDKSCNPLLLSMNTRLDNNLKIKNKEVFTCQAAKSTSTSTSKKMLKPDTLPMTTLQLKSPASNKYYNSNKYLSLESKETSIGINPKIVRKFSLSRPPRKDCLTTYSTKFKRKASKSELQHIKISFPHQNNKTSLIKKRISKSGKLECNYMDYTNKMLEKFKMSGRSKKEQDKESAEQSNLSIMTISSNESSTRIKSMSRKKVSNFGSKSLQAEIDLLFGRKREHDDSKLKREPEAANKKRISLLGKISKAVNNNINIFTKLSLFEEAETEIFDNPEYREHMEDVLLCEYVTTKNTSMLSTDNVDKSSCSPLKSINKSVTDNLDKENIRERFQVDMMADSMIESSIYGVPRVPIKSNSSKEKPSNVVDVSYFRSKCMSFVQNAESTNTVSETSITLFAIFDGHGGSQVSTKAMQLLPQEIHSKIGMKTNENLIKPLLKECFEAVDIELMIKIPNCDDIGSTCTICFITKGKTNRVLNIANIGDSHAYLISNKQAVRLTKEHKCDNEEEFNRVREKNAIIFQNRMFGQLALTRAFCVCDRKHKPYGLTATPSINQIIIKEKPLLRKNEISEVEYDLYVIIASDGIWDVITEADLMKNFVKGDNLSKPTKVLSKQLLDYAIKQGSTDNISLIVVKL